MAQCCSSLAEQLRASQAAHADMESEVACLREALASAQAQVHGPQNLALYKHPPCTGADSQLWWTTYQLHAEDTVMRYKSARRRRWMHAISALALPAHLARQPRLLAPAR